MAELAELTASIPEPKLSDKDYVSFANYFNQQLGLVQSILDQKKADDPEGVQKFTDGLMSLKPAEAMQTVIRIADQVKVSQVEKEGAAGKAEAALRGFQRTAFFDIPAKVGAATTGAVKALAHGENPIQGAKDELIQDEERSRLLSKAFPGYSFGGQAGGFLPGGAAGKVPLTGGKLVLSVEQGIAKLAENFVARAAAKPSIASAIGKVATKTVATGAGFGALEGATALVDEGAKVATGRESFTRAAKNVGSATLEGVEAGATLGGAFAAGGALASGAAKLTTKTFQGAARMLGKDLRYQVDNLGLVREVLEKTPDLVIAESAEKIAPIMKAEQAKLKGMEISLKNNLLTELQNKKLEFTQGLQKNSKALSDAVAELRQAEESNVAAAARKVYDEAEKSYVAINADYGKELKSVIKNTESRVDMAPPLSHIEQILRPNGALDKSGRLLPDSDWAQKNPVAFNQLGDLWQRLGGEVRAQGGAQGVTKNLGDAILIKQQVGQLANFGTRATYQEKVFRDLYSKIRVATEKAAPELGPINAKWASNRAKLDVFRSAIGRGEEKVAAKLRKNLEDNRFTFTREYIEAFGEVTPSGGKAASAAFDASQRLALISEFPKNPKTAFNKVRAAFVQGDLITMQALERVANSNPKLKQILNTAKKQAETLKNLPTAEEAGQAFQSPEIAQRVSEALPQTQAAIDAAGVARQRSAELQRVLPDDRLALEQELRKQQFGGTALQQQLIQQTAKANPSIAEPLKRAEAARVTDRIFTQSGAQRTAVEELPVLGGVLFGLRKASTPLAATMINAIGKSPPKLRTELISDLWTRLTGSETFPRESLDRLIKGVGAEAALIIYAQNGGEDDIKQAAEQMGGHLGSE